MLTDGIMLTLEQLEEMTEEELDEIVHDLKSLEATEINNRGKDSQIDFILLSGGIKTKLG